MLGLLFTAGLAAVATAAPAALLERADAQHQGPQPAGKFVLQIIETDKTYHATDSLGYHTGDFLSSYHTGAGLNALVTTNNQSQAIQFNYDAKTGKVGTKGGNDYPYNIGLYAPTDDSKPKGYGVVTLNVGDDGNPFHFDNENFMQFGPTEKAGKTFSICNREIYVGGVFPPTLSTRTPDHAKNATCSDVKVKAVVLA